MRSIENIAQYSKNYYLNNKNRLNLYKKEYYRRNKEKYRLAQKRYRNSHKTDPIYTKKQIGWNKNWQKRNPHKLKEYARKSYQKNKEGIDKINALWRGKNRRRVAFLVRKYKVAKKTNGSHTLAEWETLKAQYNWTCPCCSLKELFVNQKFQFLTEDHIIPISRGGSNNIENIQPLCKSCNSKKHTQTTKFVV